MRIVFGTHDIPPNEMPDGAISISDTEMAVEMTTEQFKTWIARCDDEMKDRLVDLLADGLKGGTIRLSKSSN